MCLDACRPSHFTKTWKPLEKSELRSFFLWTERYKRGIPANLEDFHKGSNGPTVELDHTD